MTTPPRRHSPAVYRRRRLAVVLALLLVVAAVSLAIWRPWEAWGSAGAAPASSDTPRPSASGTPAVTESASPSPTPRETAEQETASPSPDPSATLAVCASGDVTVTAVTDKTAYGAGDKPQLSISITNNGGTECVMNVGTAAQTFTIASGTDTWWRSTDCQQKPSNQMVKLEAGKTVTSVEPLVWDRTRSSVDTCDGDRPPALAGYYNLTVTIGGIESEPRQFALN